ncbi:MAG: MFS transporter [Kiritimatiellia bacterium]
MTKTSRLPGKAVLIYLVPALVDLVLSLVIFVGTIRVARLGGDATRAGSALAVWSLIYVLVCPLIGRLVTARNAHQLVLAGCLLFALSCGLLTLAVTFLPMILLIGVIGLASALFFVSFQILMKDFDAAGGRPLSYSVGLYTFSWSAGFAFGPLAAGFLMQHGAPATAGADGNGWRYAFGFGAVVALALTAVLSVAFRGRSRQMTDAAKPQPPMAAQTIRTTALPDLAWLGWISAAAGFVALAVNRTVFASRAVSELHLTDSFIGAIFFTFSMAQALTGLALFRSRSWMYRPLPVATLALPGILGLLAFGFCRHPALLVAGAALFGIYSGGFCFYFVYHSLAHLTRAEKYIAVNETIVGLASFAAPLLGGLLADAWGVRYPFLAAAGLTLLVTALQIGVHRKSRLPL